MTDSFKYIEEPPTPALAENYYTHTAPDPYYDQRNEQLGAPDDRRLDKEATRLWIHLQACQAYKKYRMRQPKASSSTKDQKWPEFMEKAFCRGRGNTTLSRSTDNQLSKLTTESQRS